MPNSLYIELQVLIPVGILLIVSARFMRRLMIRPAETEKPSTVAAVRATAAGKV